jgi:hypothetical protein
MNSIFSHISPFSEQNVYLTNFGSLIVIYTILTQFLFDSFDLF